MFTDSDYVTLRLNVLWFCKRLKLWLSGGIFQHWITARSISSVSSGSGRSPLATAQFRGGMACLAIGCVGLPTQILCLSISRAAKYENSGCRGEKCICLRFKVENARSIQHVAAMRQILFLVGTNSVGAKSPFPILSAKIRKFWLYELNR